MTRKRFVYKPGPLLGVGGSAKVHAGYLPDGRDLAIKQLTAGVSEEVLIREADVLSRLRHPNVVKFYALQPTADDANVLELVTERVQGVDLAALGKAGRLPPNVAVYIMRQVLEALAYVHSAEKVVHRDLSPRNILVCEDGAVKVADFGIARLVGAERTTRGVRGTPSYMSPEQLGGHEKLDGRSDLFAVGVNLYRLLTGELPFGDERAEQLEGLPVSPLTARCPELPEELDRAVLALLALDRDDRPGSAREVLQSLPGSSCDRATLVWWMRHRGLTAAPAPKTERSPRRVPAWAALAAGIALGMIGVFVGLPEITEALDVGADENGTAERIGEHHSSAAASPDEPEGVELAPVLHESTLESRNLSMQPAAGHEPTAPGRTDARPSAGSSRPPITSRSRNPRVEPGPENVSTIEDDRGLEPEETTSGATYHLPIRSGESVYFPPEEGQKSP